MTLTPLITPDTHPVRTLHLARLQLSPDEPYCLLTTEGEELALYPLSGQVQVRVNRVGSGLLGGREQLTQPLPNVLRLPAGPKANVALTCCSRTADVLVLHGVPPCNDDPDQPPPAASASAPLLQQADIVTHAVGTGTHQRTVTEVVTPPGFSLHVGETLNIPGGQSSYPPHATAWDIEQFRMGRTTWQEVMWFSGPQEGFVDFNGWYSTLEYVHGLCRLENGSAHVMPLGSHTIYAAAGSPLFYVWAYCGNALSKQYNQWADQGWGTYVK